MCLKTVVFTLALRTQQARLWRSELKDICSNFLMSVVLFTDSQKLISERMKDDNDGEDHNRERIKEQLVFVAPKVNLT